MWACGIIWQGFFSLNLEKIKLPARIPFNSDSSNKNFSSFQLRPNLQLFWLTPKASNIQQTLLIKCYNLKKKRNIENFSTRQSNALVYLVESIAFPDLCFFSLVQVQPINLFQTYCFPCNRWCIYNCMKNFLEKERESGKTEKVCVGERERERERERELYIFIFLHIFVKGK